MGEVMGGELGAEAIMAMGEAALEAATRVGEMAIQTAEAVGPMARMAEASGVAEKEYQKLSFAFRKVGGDSQMLKDALGTLSERATDAQMGAQGIVDDFSTLGITVDQLRNKQPGELFRLVAKRVRNTESDTRALKGAVSLLGDEVGNKLAGRLRSGEKGLEALRQQAEQTSVVLGEKQVTALRDADNAIEVTRSSFQGLRRQISAALAPTMKVGAEEMTNFADALQKPDTQETIEDLAQLTTGLIKATSATGDLVATLGQVAETKIFQGTLSTFASSLTGGASDNLLKAAEGIKRMGEQAEEQQQRLRSFEGRIKSIRQSVGGGSNALTGEVDRLREMFLRYGEDSKLVETQLADFKEQLKSVANEAESARKTVGSFEISDDFTPGKGFAEALEIDEGQLQAFEQLGQQRVEMQRTRLQLARTEDDVAKAQLQKRLGMLQAEQTRLQAKSKGVSAEERELKMLKAQTQEAQARKRHEKQIQQISRNKAEEQGSQTAAGVASTATSMAKSATPPEGSGRSVGQILGAERSVGGILGTQQARDRAKRAEGMRNTPAGADKAIQTAKREQKASEGRLKQQKALGQGLGAVGEQSKAIGQTADEAARLAESMDSVSESTSNAVSAISGMGDPLATAAQGMAQVAKKGAQGKKAFAAQAQAISGITSAVGGFASAMVESEKKKAQIKAATEAAASVASFGAYAASGFTAIPLLTASVKHGAAAGMYGAIAGGASGGGASKGKKGGGGGGGGGGGSAAPSASSGGDFNVKKQRQKTLEGFAKAIENQQTTRPIEISVDAKNAALPSENPRFIEDTKKGLEKVTRNTISAGGG
jgi:hypothetical protein